jgi:hypothetical protein
MGYNPGVQRLSPLDVAEFREKQHQFDQELPTRQLQGQSYAKQVGLQEKEQEQKRKETLRMLKEENDRQQQLAVAYGMPKELAQASSVGELRGFTEKAALDHAEKARQFRDDDQKLRDREQAATDKANREALDGIGKVVDVNGEQWVRNTPQSITPVRNTAKEEAAKQKEISELNKLLRGLEQGITPGMQRSFEDMNPNEQMRYQYAMNRLAELGALGQVDVAAPGTAAPAQGAKPAAGVKPAAKPTDKWKVNK